MTMLSGWRLALRLAWREAWRAKGRSLLVLVMVTFPVVAVVAADVAQATSNVSTVEALNGEMGTAAAQVSFSSENARATAQRLAQVGRVLGGQRPRIRVANGMVGIHTRLGVLDTAAVAVDVQSPLARGLFRLTSGRLPTRSDEVDINASLAAQGHTIGDTLTEADGTRLTVVGTAEDARVRTAPFLLGTSSFQIHRAAEVWLFGGPPVTWAQVQAAERASKGTVLSREVVEHPPTSVRRLQSSNGDQKRMYSTLVLIAAMALMEVVLLAGPAFAVGARRQSRSLALISANGGTPAQARRVVLGTAVVIGAFAAVTGVGLGIAVARLMLPVLQRMSDSYFGPFQIRWEHVFGTAAFGLVSALLAAIVPAWVASRQDVVAVLAGRRGDRAASRRTPFVGLGVIGLGVVVAVLGARRSASELLIAGAAVLCVMGMVFCVPMVVVGVARLGRPLPLPLRYAVRDAARHRTRTVPAVAAVAATVAGIVTLSIGDGSRQAWSKATYTQQLPVGTSSIAFNGGHPDVGALERAVLRVAPQAYPQPVVGVQGSRPLLVDNLGSGSFSSLPLQALVSDGSALPALLRGELGGQWPHASSVLQRGGVVVLGPRSRGVGTSLVRLRGRPGVRVPSATVAVAGSSRFVSLVISPEVAHKIGLRPRTVGLLVTGQPLTSSQESDLEQVVASADNDAYVYTERGYQVPSTEQVVLWILFGLAIILMLGGTLTSTFLALSDARPDLATLSAVGASPVTRRAVAAAYAVSVGLVGALLGAAVGFVPGIAISYPLTRTFDPAASHAHYLAIPWLQIIGLVVALPLVTAALVGVAARSRLPLVARLD